MCLTYVVPFPLKIYLLMNLHIMERLLWTLITVSSQVSITPLVFHFVIFNIEI